MVRWPSAKSAVTVPPALTATRCAFGAKPTSRALTVNDPAAMPFHPLARQVADNYLERMKLEGQVDKQGQQLKDSQRKSSELQDKLDKLQEKLDSLADIERTLSPRPRAIGSKR